MIWIAGDAPAGAPVWQQWLPAILVALLAGVATVAAGVWVKKLNRRLDDATADKTTAESRKALAETTSIEVATARGLIADIKSAMADQRAEFLTKDAEKTEQIKQLASQSAENREQLRALRSAFGAHSTWDADAVAALRQHLPAFPDPPPVNFD